MNGEYACGSVCRQRGSVPLLVGVAVVVCYGGARADNTVALLRNSPVVPVCECVLPGIWYVRHQEKTQKTTLIAKKVKNRGKGSLMVIPAYDGQQATSMEGESPRVVTCVKGSGQVKGPMLTTVSLLGPNLS